MERFKPQIAIAGALAVIAGFVIPGPAKWVVVGLGATALIVASSQ